MRCLKSSGLTKKMAANQLEHPLKPTVTGLQPGAEVVGAGSSLPAFLG